MTYMALIASGIAAAGGAGLVVQGIRTGQVQTEALGLIVSALSAIAWAIIGLTKG